MGFTLVDTASLSAEVQSALSSPELSVGNILALLFNHHENVVALFDSLDADLRLKFMSWICSHFVSKKKGFFMKHLQYLTLPMWRTADGSFSPADDVRMLPQGITIESVAPFASVIIVSHDLILESMGIQTSPIRSVVKVLMQLELQLERAYQNLMRVLLAYDAKGPSIPVPNSQRLMRKSNTLYSSRDDLFLTAFGLNSEHFILLSFHNFEDQLGQFGLKRQTKLDLTMFKNCVEAFQSLSGDNLWDRAAILFQIFCEDLPLQVGMNQVYQWRLFNNLRFIPRNMTPWPLGNNDDTQYIAPHIQALPGVVSPNELVREDFQAIAWSHLPTAEEVVNHLTVLASQVAPNHPRDRILLSYLKKTYKWLNDHAQEAQQYLRQRRDIALFLNIDDPTNEAEDRTWKRARHILLDNYNTKPLQCPRDFLKNFHPLLAAAGAVTIDYRPDTENRYEQPTSEDRLTNLSNNFEQMRKKRICTDVSFICSSPDDEPLYAHRGYLAAYSGHFMGMFSRSFREAGDASHMNPIHVHVPGFSRCCVEYVPDYAYTAKAPNLKREEADIDLALEMLTLAHLWLMLDVQCALQNIVIKTKMVDPYNLDNVLSTAQHTQSMDLIHHCNIFMMRNVTLVQQVKEESAAAALN